MRYNRNDIAKDDKNTERDVRMLNKLKLRWSNFIENVQAGDKKARKWLIIYCGIILFVILGVIAVVRMNLGYHNYRVLEVIDQNDDASINYQVIGNSLLRYSKDGASYTDGSGETIWDQTFEMSNAQIASCGEYMAIADIGSNQIRVFNHAGQISVIDATYPISNVDISEQGVVAVILSASDVNYINMYDTQGNRLVDIRVSISQTGYPMDFALSEDGTKLAVSYMVVNNGEISTRLVFYKFGNAVQSAQGNVAGSFDSDMVIPKIDFINNNTMVTFGDSGFKIYSMEDDTPAEVFSQTFDEEIRSVFYNEQYIGFVFRNTDSQQAETQDQETESGQTSESAADEIALQTSETGDDSDTSLYTMRVYTSGGALYLEQDFDFEYHEITCSADEIIMYNDYDCLIMTYRGKEKFRYTFDRRIYNILPKEARNEYILIYESEIQEIRLTY